MSIVPVTYFADFTCPYSYVTEVGLWEISRSLPLELRPRAVELHPSPAPLPAPDREAEWETPVTAAAAELGLVLGRPRFRPRTRKAHEAARFAATAGAEAAVRRAIYDAFWEEERDIGRIDVLAALAGAQGLDPVGMKIALDIDQHRDEVLADEDLGKRLNVSRTPTLFIGTGSAARVLVGLQDRTGLETALAEQSAAQ